MKDPILELLLSENSEDIELGVILAVKERDLDWFSNLPNTRNVQTAYELTVKKYKKDRGIRYRNPKTKFILTLGEQSIWYIPEEHYTRKYEIIDVWTES